MTSKLWGRRFATGPNQTFFRYNRSFGFDVRLLPADVRASQAWAEALLGVGVLTADEVRRLQQGLEEILEKAQSDAAFLEDPACEDVHSFLESRLVTKLGDLGKKLHTGRSRNDQVATAFRLWLREELDLAIRKARDAQAALVELAEAHPGAVIPGYTHLQKAQPVLWAHWCLAYSEMLNRDLERLEQARARTNVLPLGSGALAGTSYAVDRPAIAKRLGFDSITRNSLDAVSDRDFALDALFAASTTLLHLSRLSEDLIVYSSTEFGFLELGDAISTGSSLMPQKKNPDAFELLRGKTGRVFGALTGLLVTAKGLPLAYNKDLQEDKEAVFDALDTLTDSLEVAAICLRSVKLREARARAASETGYMNATELADYFVSKGLPFREAHDAVGRVVREGLKTSRELQALSVAEIAALVPALEGKLVEAEIRHCLSLESTLARKQVPGGTAPEQVQSALNVLKKRLKS
jgi:argininosuccinate lyase